MRKIINISIGVIILLGAVFFGKYIIDSRNEPVKEVPKIVQRAYIDTVQNTVVPVVISANGNLTALRKVELFAEVQGILQSKGKMFREGQKYNTGEVLLSLDASEFYASVQAQKSNLFNLIASIMPDLKLDFPEISDKWQQYLNNFDITKTTPALPQIESDKERFFLAGRNIITTFYNVKNLEERLSKFTIRAPFSGILTEALVTEGTLVRNGQKLGEFIDPNVYELQVSVSKTFSDLLRIGKKVQLNNINKTLVVEGEVVRINGRVDQATQTVSAFIQVKSPELKEGMYMEANIAAQNIENAIQVPRTLLLDDRQLYVVKDSILDLIEVSPSFFGDKEVIIQGIPNGTHLVTRNIPGAYKGMLVEVVAKN
ncbi:MAG: HlyD family efflux transporter periplasmic adaptor subunit [Flavobacteriaceae bacterium]|nr:HlyD family efflux transporter periplasmic adaptor subunit [Flavobacteriaceae bacterium]